MRGREAAEEGTRVERRRGRREWFHARKKMNKKEHGRSRYQYTHEII